MFTANKKFFKKHYVYSVTFSFTKSGAAHVTSAECPLYSLAKVSIRIYSRFWIGQMSWVFANGPVDQGLIPGLVIPKTQKMVLGAALLNTQHYKVWIMGKVEQSREWSSALPLHLRELSGHPRLKLPTLFYFMYQRYRFSKANVSLQVSSVHYNKYTFILPPLLCQQNLVNVNCISCSSAMGKCKQSHSGFELMLQSPFPMIITIALEAHPSWHVFSLKPV